VVRGFEAVSTEFVGDYRRFGIYCCPNHLEDLKEEAAILAETPLIVH
jgi:hypothetical protein